MIHFKKSSQFETVRCEIEQHLYDSVFEIEQNNELALRSVEHFSRAFERLLDTLEGMYTSLTHQDISSEKSFPIRDGRYRVFYKITLNSNNDIEITFLDIDDNKQSNLDRFPSHLISFNSEE
jgi:hypothetical protein